MTSVLARIAALMRDTRLRQALVEARSASAIRELLVRAEDAYLADSIIPNFLDQPLPESLYADLQRRDLMPTWGEDSVDAAAARPEEAELLGIPAGAPVLRIARRAFAGSIALEVSRSTFRADRYTLWMPLSRPNTPVTPSR
mgnify:CR=1 FL=1